MLAWDGKRLVGQEAANLLRVFSNNQEYLGLLIFDTMTDPEYQRLGIFTNVARKFYKELAGNGYQFVFGFPNANVIYARVNKLDWRIICLPPIYIRPLDMGNFISKKTKSAFLGNCASRISKMIFSPSERNRSCESNPDINIRKDSGFQEWANVLWEKCKNQHNLWVVRDYKYLSWRYDMRPETSYNLYTAWLNDAIAGYIITTEIIRAEGKVVFVADLLADVRVNGVVDDLLNTVIFESVKNDAAMISSIVMPNSAYKAAFRKNCFLRLPARLFPQEIYFGAYSLNRGISENILYNPNSWYISWGDTDLL